jgi:hypothetical protein
LLDQSISPSTNDVRFAPDSERRSDMAGRLKCANKRHGRRFALYFYKG